MQLQASGMCQGPEAGVTRKQQVFPQEPEKKIQKMGMWVRAWPRGGFVIGGILAPSVMKSYTLERLHLNCVSQ